MCLFMFCVHLFCFIIVFFFFSSRRRHTRSLCDWSLDVCSSDLIPEIKGMKHSSLDRLIELERLKLRGAHRPDFRVYTGNDLGIDMIEYGSDYLLGLATFAPEKFAERDRLWETGDPVYYALSDALQYLGNVP